MESITGVLPVVANRMATRMVCAAPSWESTVTVYWTSEIGAEIGCWAGREANERRNAAAARPYDRMCRLDGGRRYCSRESLAAAHGPGNRVFAARAATSLPASRFKRGDADYANRSGRGRIAPRAAISALQKQKQLLFSCAGRALSAKPDPFASAASASPL